MASDRINKIWDMWTTAKVTSTTKTNLVEQAAILILKNQQRYESITNVTGIPFYVIGAIHYRESSLNFSTHLANGDPLFSKTGEALKTVHVPAGLGPFNDWEEGAVAALKQAGFTHGYHWDLVNALDNVEIYNGLGYRNLGLPSPYVWSMTNHYAKGQYVKDNVYDHERVDGQAGCAALFMALKSHGVYLNEVRPA